MVERVKSMRTAVAPSKSPTKSIASLMTQTTDIENDPKMLKRIQEEEGLDIIDEDKYFDPDEADQFEQNEVKGEEEQEKEKHENEEKESNERKSSTETMNSTASSELSDAFATIFDPKTDLKAVNSVFRYLKHRPKSVMYDDEMFYRDLVAARTNDLESSLPPEVARPKTTHSRARKPLEVYIDGAHGAPSSAIFQAEHAVLVATGIGVTPFASILQSIMHQ